MRRKLHLIAKLVNFFLVPVGAIESKFLIWEVKGYFEAIFLTHWCVYAHLRMPTHRYVDIRQQEWDVYSPYKTDDIWDNDVQGVAAGDQQ